MEYKGPQSYPTRAAPFPPPNSFYPRITPTTGLPINRPLPPPLPAAPAAAAASPSPSLGLGIRMSLKPRYQIAQPAPLSPITGEVPKTTINFDFEFERRVLANLEADKPLSDWRIPSHGQQNGQILSTVSSDEKRSQSMGEDPVISKYVGMGYSKEAVVMGVAAYGDVQNKVMEFCPSYNLLREMGFPSTDVAAALVKYDNDRERALAYFV